MKCTQKICDGEIKKNYLQQLNLATILPLKSFIILNPQLLYSAYTIFRPFPINEANYI